MDQLLHPSDTVDLARVARLVRPFETLEFHAVRRPGGGWSIGYGHVRSAREGARVTREEADALLIYDLRHAAQVVRSAIYAPINRNQLEALIAFAFHIGTQSFLRSTALHRFNAGDSLGAAQELERWCRADLGGEPQVVDALVRRRAAEKAHFLTPPQGFPKVSRARVRPQVEAGSGKTDEPAPSAALAAAHSVSARLRALVPDLAEQGELRPSRFEPEPVAPEPVAPEPVAPEPIEPGSAEPEAAPSLEPATPELYEAFAPPETEIPPPPMPFELAEAVATDAARPEPAPTKSGPSDPETFDVWPSFTPTAGGVGDPFADGPLDGASIEAPPIDRPAPAAGLLRAKPEPKVQSAPPPTAARRPPSLGRMGSSVSPLWLSACLAIGVAIFVWSVWSIFKIGPVPVNFVAGLVGIAVMAVPAYLLLGLKGTRSS